MTGRIHTISIKTEDEITNGDQRIDNCMKSIRRADGKGITASIINPNRLLGDIYKYSEFETALETITAGAGITDYWITRVDMRFDSFDKEHYKKYAKLNRLLVSMIAATYDVKNRYRTVDLFSERQLSVALKTDEFEVENYDKARESNEKDRAKSRFELRSKRMKGRSIEKEFCENWPKRWRKALKNFKAVGERYNEELIRIYRIGCTEFPKQFAGITDFLIKYQNCIFTKEQLLTLLEKLGVQNPETKYKNHKQRYGIELFRIEDVECAINEINIQTRKFFEKIKNDENN